MWITPRGCWLTPTLLSVKIKNGGFYFDKDMLMNREWNDELNTKLREELANKRDTILSQKYANAFSASYQDDYSTDIALSDIRQIEKLTPQQTIHISLYAGDANELHLRLYQYLNFIPLSDVLPMLENMDLRTLNENPHKVTTTDATIWISDFIVTYSKSSPIVIETIKHHFKEAFISTYLGYCENDGFNKLILGAGLSWRETSILRAYAKYLKQAGFIYSQSYIENALVANTEIARKLVLFFNAKHDPSLSTHQSDETEQAINQLLENIASLDEDRILRRILQLIKATVRTNYFQTQADGNVKPYIALKLSSHDVPELPLPLPLYEIFIYSPRFEGIHLRNSKVARGGIRWSDRREDFRTEVLGLMKAQTVKNAVIVPSGAKGGFVLKALPLQATREIIQTELITCYKLFICGLLDLTDNLIDGKVVPPQNVKCYDEADTYLVVAADKGTATFSDTANSLSKKYNFWLGDAFASGGSAGYDHKKMGITARGAWESVKRHFRELDIDIAEHEFTAVGIGDMSGDVFGNGAIYSANMKLLAAFDHRDIFLDPTPDANISFQERSRLFNLPTSSWQDYNPTLISKGGGVFKRISKSIPISPEVQLALGISETSLIPNELIKAILKAPVDLLFNGGIGTYVKSVSESHADVGDKTNEYCRINGADLRCKIVGEGGNLGFTQLGRIEFALQNKGLICTDFIDNSAGVDCSDHEVNIKILLNQEMAKGKLSEPDRNSLLVKMTHEVADLVLNDNYQQALVLSFVNFYSPQMISLHQSYIKALEVSSNLDRAVEFLPDDKKLLERKAAGLGLTRPELAILLAYSKIHIKAEILKSNLPEDEFLRHILFTAFPATLKKDYLQQMEAHSLHREIIATQLSNQIVNEMGILFVYNLQTETGATVAEIMRAFVVASNVFGAVELQKLIVSLDFKISMPVQFELMSHIRRLIYLSTRWFIRHQRLDGNNMPAVIEHFSTGVKELEVLIPMLMGGTTKSYLQTLSEQFMKVGISETIARRIGTVRAMYTALNVIQTATVHQFNLAKTAESYFAVGEFFNLLWFRDQIANDAREGYWDILARLTLRDELDSIQKLLTTTIMLHAKKATDPHQAIEEWIVHHQHAIERWDKMLEVLHGSTNVDYVMFFIALRGLTELIHTPESA
jgi:glutamate dehydrogenase